MVKVDGTSGGARHAVTRRLALSALGAGVVSLHLWSLMRFPAPFVDEAWNISRAWAYLQTGKVFGPLDSGVFDRFDGYWTFFPWLHHFLLSLALRAFGAPELLAGRLVSLLFGLVLLVAVYLIGHRFGGRWLGGLGALLTSLSWPFLYSAHMARADVLVAAFGFAAIALHLHRPPRVRWSVLSGLLVGLALEMHPHAMIYGPVIVGLFVWEWRRATMRQLPLWGFLAGTGLGLAFYASLHVLPFPKSYAAMSQLGFTSSYVPPLFTLSLTVMAQAFEDMGAVLIYVYQSLLLLLAWALVVLAGRRGGSEKWPVVLCLDLALAYSILVRRKGLHYAILFTPGIDLLLAAFLLDLFRRPWRGGVGEILRQAIVWGTCLGYLAGNFSPLRFNAWEAYQDAQVRINAVVRPAETVMGSQTYWFGLYDHAYYSWEQLIYFQRYAPGSGLEDALREFRPELFVIDRHLDSFVSDVGAASPPSYLLLPESELLAFLDRQAYLVDEFENESLGPIRVYRIHWP